MKKNLLTSVFWISALTLLLHGASFSQSTDSVMVTFRYDDPARQKIRVFLPGSFNNWGPNNNGAITTGAPSQMDYDSAGGYWFYRIKLQVGGSYPYKIYFHLNQSGSQWLWISDPLNPQLDGSQYDNSLIRVSDPMIFEPTEHNDSTGVINVVKAGIFSSAGITRIQLVINSDTANVMGFYNTLLNVLSYHPVLPPSPDASVVLLIGDAVGRAYTYEFPRSIPPPASTVPSWAEDAVWYQIFPERFRNGDPGNDPVRGSLEEPQYVPLTWQTSPWTGDWYARAPWEVAEGSSFTNGVFDRRYGGDLQGVLDKLDYLDSLGINAIYFNPIFYARSLHKYECTAYQHVDPYFGPDPQGDIALIQQETLDPSTWHWTSADSLFLRLLGEAHRRGIRVILDGVFDHCGRDFYAFKDVLTYQAQSSYKDWFTIYSFYDPHVPGSQFTYKSWNNYAPMPEFATSLDGSNLAPGPKQFIFEICRRWMDPNGDGDPSDGIDGWRLDTVPDVPVGFWTEWNTYIRSINPDVYTTSEVWTDATYYIKEGRFSGTMNYAACAFPIYNYLTWNTMLPSQFMSVVSGYMASYGRDATLVCQNLADSHDTERLASMIVNAPLSTGWGSINSPLWNSAYLIRKPNARERQIQRLALLAQVTIPGAPMIYYGDEAGMWGATDPDDRKPMPWPDLHFAPQATDPRGYAMTPDDANFDSVIYNGYKSALALRHLYPSLRRGDFQQMAVNDSAGALAFSRSLSGEMMLVYFNRDSQSVWLNVPLSLLPANPSFQFVYSTAPDSTPVHLTFVNNNLSVNVPALSGAVMMVKSPASLTLKLSAGWNMISVPVKSTEYRRSVLYPGATSSAFLYDTLAGYLVEDSLVSGNGYWIKYGRQDSVSVSGYQILAETLSLHAGWNIIGSLSSPLPVSSITSNPAGMSVSRFFGYDDGYTASDTIMPGKSYWVKVNQSCTLYLSYALSRQTPSPVRAIHIVAGDDTPPPPPAVEPGGQNIPKSYALDQAYPNPFNPSATIQYQLPLEGRISLKIYNLLGEMVADLIEGVQPAGFRQIVWNAGNFPSGIYFCRMNSSPLGGNGRSFTGVIKLVLVK